MRDRQPDGQAQVYWQASSDPDFCVSAATNVRRFRGPSHVQVITLAAESAAFNPFF